MPHEGFKGIKWSSQKQAMVDFCGSKNIGNFNKAILSEGFKKKKIFFWNKIGNQFLKKI